MNSHEIVEEHREIFLLLRHLVKGYGMKNVTVNFEAGPDMVLKRKRLDFLASFGLVETIDQKENKFIVSVAPTTLSFYSHYYYAIEEFMKIKLSDDDKIDLINRVFRLDKGSHCANCCDTYEYEPDEY